MVDEKYKRWVAKFIVAQSNAGLPLLRDLKRSRGAQVFFEATKNWSETDLRELFEFISESFRPGIKYTPHPLWIRLDSCTKPIVLRAEKAVSPRIKVSSLKKCVLEELKNEPASFRLAGKTVNLAYSVAGYEILLHLDLLSSHFDLAMSFSILEDGRPAINHTSPLSWFGIWPMTTWENLVEDEIPATVNTVASCTRFFVSEMAQALG